MNRHGARSEAAGVSEYLEFRLHKEEMKQEKVVGPVPEGPHGTSPSLGPCLNLFSPVSLCGACLPCHSLLFSIPCTLGTWKDTEVGGRE